MAEPEGARGLATRVLSGGNMNVVVRDGDTVVRPAGPWTPTIHRYLDFLAAAGIDGIPQVLGVEAGRERLSFLPGDVPAYPLPPWVWRDEVLMTGARLLRRLHDASTGFVGDVWQLPAHEPVEVICHNDFAPHNLVFAEGVPVGVIDFDTCSPGSRLWDLAYFAVRAVPLTADPPPQAPLLADARRRVGLILGGYGSHNSFDDVLGTAAARLTELAHYSRAKAVELSKPELREHAAGYDRDAVFLDRLIA